MAGLEAAELRELVRQMYAASADNKRLLSALLEGDRSGLKIKVTQEIEKAFGTAQSRRWPSLKTGAARTALQHYAKFAPPSFTLSWTSWKRAWPAWSATVT
ncbi:hypothetical protein EHF33_02660 [Deinococcus psychrotolerans]|uniref:Uncharacterized protein n=1 Tax=Deinococcus psychrotolerans TaxID=2489213 RepID=A0A3G8YGV3_9DEIO|nr:hypothetical protein [Deinococcus psychrotolerans]AZI41784.1 hypothetical protein EHF33_02660 [Deinococcus psychrotolerans]